MAALSEARLATLISPYLWGPWGEADVPTGIYGQLSVYLDLLLRWNERTNLTAIREPEEIVCRHFGESLFAGLCVGMGAERGTTLLDVGSGAGFPGLPIRLLRPAWRVTVAESQGKKVAFLREVGRVLGLAVEVWPRRVEELPAERRFDAVTLRAVDRMQTMVTAGWERVAEGGVLLQFSTVRGDGTAETFPLPERANSFVVLQRKPTSVPRGTFWAAPDGLQG